MFSIWGFPPKRDLILPLCTSVISDAIDIFQDRLF